MFHLSAAQPQRKSNPSSVKSRQARCRIDREAEDFFRCIGGNFLDVHAAFGRTDKRDARRLAIHQQGKIKFGLDARAVLDIDPVDLFSGRTRLVRDQRAPQHLFSFLGRFRD